jgi:hypothetical protein
MTGAGAAVGEQASQSADETTAWDDLRVYGRVAATQLLRRSRVARSRTLLEVDRDFRFDGRAAC